MGTSEQTQTIIVKQKRGCLSGCLITLLIIVLLCILAPYILGIGIFAFLGALIGLSNSDSSIDSKSHNKDNSSYTTIYEPKKDKSTTIVYNDLEDEYDDPDYFSDDDIFADDIAYRYYSNSRFKFCIPYPKNFNVGQAPENGDGRVFSGKNAELRVSGSWKNWEIKELFENSKEWKHTVTYERLGNNWFVLSGYDKNGKIYYQKTVYNENEGDTITVTAVLTYDESEKQYYGKMIKYVFNQLK